MESKVARKENNVYSLFSKKPVYFMIETDPVEKPIKQYLYFAYRRSLRDAESYASVAESIPKYDERSTFFKEMEDRKYEEAEKLHSYYRTEGYKIIKDMKRRSIISHPHYESQIQSSDLETIEDSYAFAYKKETHNLELYSNLAKMDSNTYTKLLFDYLAHLENDLIAYIDKKFSLANLRSQKTAVL
jgi:hypothetical protein